MNTALLALAWVAAWLAPPSWGQGILLVPQAATASGRCAQPAVEYLLGGGASAAPQPCMAARAAIPARGTPGPGGVGGGRQGANLAQQERRQILEQELQKELELAQQVQAMAVSPQGTEGVRRQQALRRHESNAAALRAEIGRLP